jgi:hypothetical protein
MGRFYFILVSLFFIIIIADAKEIVSKTAIDSLIENDDAVVLEEKVICKIKSKDRIDYSYSVKIFIKNNKAERYGIFGVSESEYIEVDDIKGKMILKNLRYHLMLIIQKENQNRLSYCM